MSLLEKVKNRVSIQNMPTFCHATLSIEMDVTTENEVIDLQNES